MHVTMQTVVYWLLRDLHKVGVKFGCFAKQSRIYIVEHLRIRL